MRAKFLLIPAALVSSIAPNVQAHAKVFMDIKQAQRLMFPGASFTSNAVRLSETGAGGLERQTRSTAPELKQEVWRVSTGGWFVVDQVLGKDDVITYAVGLSDDGKVRQLEILECLADYDTITMPEWRAQFHGRGAGDSLADVQTISGTTLSSRHIIDGVKQILSTHAIFIRSNDG